MLTSEYLLKAYPQFARCCNTTDHVTCHW